MVIAGTGVQQHLDFVGYWRLADAGLVNAPQSDAAQEEEPGTLTSDRRHFHELPMGARRDALRSPRTRQQQMSSGHGLTQVRSS